MRDRDEKEDTHRCRKRSRWCIVYGEVNLSDTLYKYLKEKCGLGDRHELYDQYTSRALQCTLQLLCFLTEGLNCTRLKLAKNVVDSPLPMKVLREEISSNPGLAVVTVSFPAPTLLLLQDGILCNKSTWGSWNTRPQEQ